MSGMSHWMDLENREWQKATTDEERMAIRQKYRNLMRQEEIARRNQEAIRKANSLPEPLPIDTSTGKPIDDPIMKQWKEMTAPRRVSPTGFPEDSPEQLEAQRNFYQRVSGSSPTDEQLLALNAEKRQPGYAERQAAQEEKNRLWMERMNKEQAERFADTPQNAARKRAYEAEGITFEASQQKAANQQRQYEIDEELKNGTWKMPEHLPQQQQQPQVLQSNQPIQQIGQESLMQKGANFVRNGLGAAARGIGNAASSAAGAYRKLPVAAQVAHAVVSPLTGIPAAAAAHSGAIGRGVRKFGSGIANLGKRAVGGIAGAFRR